MHTATVQVLSVRQDGKGFKAELPGKGEQWLSLPDNMKGQVEWKKSYDIGWTENPRKDGGFFYNIKQLNAKTPPQPTNGHASNGKANSDPRQIFVCAIVKEWVGNIPVGETSTLISAIQSAMDAYDQTFGHGQ